MLLLQHLQLHVTKFINWQKLTILVKKRDNNLFSFLQIKRIEH